MQMDDRRSEGRFLCADLVRIDWLGGDDHLRSEQALLEDIAPQGGCVQLEEPVPAGIGGNADGWQHTVLRQTFATATFRDDAYFIGLRFSDNTVWSEGLVAPQHLTNLQQLGQRAQAQN